MIRIILIMGIFLNTNFIILYSQSYIYSENIIKPQITECNDSININNYFNLYGINISKFYTVIDSISMNVEAEKKIYKIFILSPYYQEEVISNNNCNVNQTKRLLIIFQSDNNSKFMINGIYDNIILNSIDSQS